MELAIIAMPIRSLTTTSIQMQTDTSMRLMHSQTIKHSGMILTAMAMGTIQMEMILISLSISLRSGSIATEMATEITGAMHPGIQPDSLSGPESSLRVQP